MRVTITIGLILLIGNGAGAKDPRGGAEILARVDALIADEARAWSHAVGIDYPPEVVVFRAFKRELELEIWAADDRHGQLSLVRTLPICAVIEERGPKLKGYDKRTPEGFYQLAFRFKSTLPWMWIKLETGRVDDFGEVGDGSPFYMHLDYPNAVDAAHSGAAGYRVPRGQICLHGNCGTEGCVSMDNRDFLFVFAFAQHHDVERLGKPQLHLLPFRFDQAWDFATESASYVHLPKLGKHHLRRFWENLRQGHDLFERNPRPLHFTFGQPVLRWGDRSPDVRRVKRALNRAGLFDGRAGPLFDAALVRAVQGFQKSHGLPPSGEVDQATQRAVGLDWRTRYLFEE